MTEKIKTDVDNIWDELNIFPTSDEKN
jgi:hypothetical protein